MSVNILDDSEDSSLSNSICSGEWVEVWGTFIKAIDPELSYFKGRIIVDKMVLHKMVEHTGKADGAIVILEFL